MTGLQTVSPAPTPRDRAAGPRPRATQQDC
jgi:hypothetical protein